MVADITILVHSWGCKSTSAVVKLLFIRYTISLLKINFLLFSGASSLRSGNATGSLVTTHEKRRGAGRERQGNNLGYALQQGLYQ